MKYINNISKLKLLEFLNRIDLFKSLEPRDREAISNLPNLVAIAEKDSVLIKKNEYDSSFFIILSGEVSVTSGDTHIADVGVGHFIGEVGFICNEPRSATVTAKTEVILLKINKEVFDQLPIKVREIVKERIIAGLVERIAGQNKKLNQLQKELTNTQRLYADLQESVDSGKPLRKVK